jgi:hypothetical protein
VIAVLDSGLSTSADLRNQVAPGFNAMDGTSDVTANHGHGTKAASVAAATTNNGGGIAAYCWSCTIMPVKVFDTGGASHSDTARGMVWATDHGAKVISYSLSGASPTTTMLNAVRYATDRGVVVVSSAGNLGSDEPRYPAAFPEVIGVAGTTSSDSQPIWRAVMPMAKRPMMRCRAGAVARRSLGPRVKPAGARHRPPLPWSSWSSRVPGGAEACSTATWSWRTPPGWRTGPSRPR